MRDRAIRCRRPLILAVHIAVFGLSYALAFGLGFGLDVAPSQGLLIRLPALAVLCVGLTAGLRVVAEVIFERRDLPPAAADDERAGVSAGGHVIGATFHKVNGVGAPSEDSIAATQERPRSMT